MNFLTHLTKRIKSLGRNLATYRDRTERFDHFLAVCAIFKNEALYLNEWLNFHQKIGVDHFYLYNDGSEDDYVKVLAPWIKKGLVTIVHWNGKGQKAAYNDCIKRNRMKAKWIAFIDLDEFLFSPLTADIKSALKQYSHCAAIFVYWVLFGSSGHIKRPQADVIKSYTRCMDFQSAINDNFDHQKNKADMSNYVTGWSQDGKSIVNPRLVREYNIHHPKRLWKGSLLDENGVAPKLKNIGKETTLSYSILRINHYWSKSIEDIVDKVEKGSVCNNKRPKRNLARWLEREKQLNVSEDTAIIDILNK